MERGLGRRRMGSWSVVFAGQAHDMKRSTIMVLLSRMQLDERIRQEALLRATRKASLAKEPAEGETVRVSGPPKVQSQFFLQRFRLLIGRMKLQGA